MGWGSTSPPRRLAGQVLENHLAARQLTPEVGEAERIVELIEQSIELTRQLARGLSPVAVETEGLPAALTELAETTAAQFYLRCELHCPRALPGIDPAVATHLYRITQESISNAVRHGRASRVEMALATEQISLSTCSDHPVITARGCRLPTRGVQAARVYASWRTAPA